MKNSTKRKIIEWVTKVLKYYPLINISYEKKVFEVQTIKITQEFRPEERLYQNRILIQEIPDVLYAAGILEFEEQQIPIPSQEGSKTHIGIVKFQVIKRQIK